MLALMTEGKFTPRAAVLWGTIPKDARVRLLANVFCSNCSNIVEIADFTGDEENGDLVLTGSCARCGYNVVRVIETSERDSSDN